MGKHRRTLFVVLAAIVVLVAVAAVTWPWWKGWLPHPALLKAWTDYLVLDLRLGQWAPILLLLVFGVAELLVGLTLYRRSGVFEKFVRRLDRQHARELDVLQQEIAILREEQHAFAAELDLREDLIREEKDHLWTRFDELQQESGLPRDKVIAPTEGSAVDIPPDVRGELRQIIAQLERIETVTSASIRRAPNGAVGEAGLHAGELVRLGGACYYLGQYERALTHYGRALSLAPNDAETLVDRALVSCALGQHGNALQDLERALKVGEDPRVYLYRGMCRERLGEDKRALEDYARAVRLDSGFAEAYYRRGLLYARQGEHTKALQDQNRALELSPDHIGAATARGGARAALGDLPGALADLDRVCILAPHLCEGFYQRGLVRRRLDMNGDALVDFSRAVELSPSLAVAYLARAETHLAAGDTVQSMADYDRAIELQPKSAAIFNARGTARVAARDYRAAIKDFDQALELDPSLALALANRGAAYEKVGDYDQAIRDLDRALVLNPSLALAYYSRGMAFGSKGEYDKASRDLNKAVELDPALGKKQRPAGATAA